MIEYSPAPRHRRRIIRRLLQTLRFDSLIDVGCGSGALLSELSLDNHDIKLAGIDISPYVIEQNRERFKKIQFYQMDIEKEHPYERFDVVVCSEVLEHTDDPGKVIANLKSLANRYLIMTVPSGKVYPLDKGFGHIRHFNGRYLKREIERDSFRISDLFLWGFPFHSLYKILINLAPHHTETLFSQSEYGLLQRMSSEVLHLLFYLNIRGMGKQLFAVAERIV
ncbi:MAG: class I SAM-dependent methyltransferase [Candidatus Tectomicrobia bacterium]|nr:class I SAM-dependent methyltransferase [Candidatus Tectomicrobia bacterium]